MVLEVPVKKGQTRLVLNLAVDWLLLLSGIPLGISSFLLWVVFPRGYYPGRVLWREIHLWSGLAFGILSLLHLLLHLRVLLHCTWELILRWRR